jgi:3-isopropylmalate/(R)-2-methylmalate dehydratase large subunit
MGHRSAKVYLANPAVAAATAVVGRIAHPDELGMEPPEFLVRRAEVAS